MHFTHTHNKNLCTFTNFQNKKKGLYTPQTYKDEHNSWERSLYKTLIGCLVMLVYAQLLLEYKIIMIMGENGVWQNVGKM